MSKHFIYSVLFTLLLFVAKTQSYDALNVSLLAHLTPNTNDEGIDGRKYSGCWGWYQAATNKEYAISGTSNGTYFYDISTPQTPTQLGFIAASNGCTYREIKTYGHYAYIVSDDAPANGLQIVDLQYLPDSVHLVSSNTNLFFRTHSVWIDGSHMYLGSTTFSNSYCPMSVWSIANPTLPVLMGRLEQDYPFIGIVHDMFSRHDTIYASCANQGLYIFNYDSLNSKFTQLGSYTGFPKAGYNHSSYLTENGKTLVFCEEIPFGLPIRLIDVQNLNNIQSLSEVIPSPQTTPHNPFVKGNFAIVSCYEDGLQIYDISDPTKPGRVGYFDTYPQGGVNTGTYGVSNYRGNWGNYPFLPSGIIIANDMQNGVFLLNASAAFTASGVDYVGLDQYTNTSEIKIGPNPTNNFLQINLPANTSAHITITNSVGQCLLSQELQASEKINLHGIKSGIYTLSLSANNKNTIKKITILPAQP